ncbi:MAG TPA: NTP transferase domain-containing protein [Cyclobacteriaceae bacterium]|jgi:molybdopterin-guanine dinucleotide biosynthesis protein A|nr:NTP transferase domain-containing protein [Cytophagales bacterium]HMR57448.1 NTP transferase domain-containing protein [Cyclobacteriaceae bacterium]HNT49848.1 NTP transferase domain-containing protein [Cyclobacteriaceae bacterium]HRE66082.1 NTP transferase domain-containing protein [Cyclobacteriaceae bacterium]HRF32227.1 NTP transferase domain-containing protein [Cyclobacteriaceae bacterium]
MIYTDIYGLVLAGGLSTRMGTDKRLLAYHGKPHGEFLFDLLYHVCERVHTSCRKEQLISASLNPIPDKYNYPGPINGIISAMETNPEKAWLIVAVDMPRVTLPTLDYLIRNRDKTKVATCFLHEPENFIEPLLTLWEPKALPLVTEYAAAGNTSPRLFLEANPIHSLRAPDQKILSNINTPEDLENYF